MGWFRNFTNTQFKYSSRSVASKMLNSITCFFYSDINNRTRKLSTAQSVGIWRTAPGDVSGVWRQATQSGDRFHFFYGQPNFLSMCHQMKRNLIPYFLPNDILNYAMWDIILSYKMVDQSIKAIGLLTKTMLLRQDNRYKRFPLITPCH